MDDTRQPTPKPEIGARGICPHCGANSWWNSWGRGNAYCTRCDREFNVRFCPGVGLVGEPVTHPQDN